MLTFLFTFLLIVTYPFTYAADQQSIRFDVNHTNQSLQTIDKRLTNPNNFQRHRDLHYLQQARDHALQCVQQANQQLKTIDDLLESRLFAASKSNTQQQDYQYLIDKKNNFAKRAADCRLFILRAQDTMLTLNKQIQQNQQSTLLQHSTPIWQQLLNIHHLSLEKFKLSIAYDRSGLSSLSKNQWIILALLLVISITVGLLLKQQLHYLISRYSNPNKRVATFFNSIRYYLVPIISLIFLNIFFHLTLTVKHLDYMLPKLTDYLLLFVISLAILTALFHPSSKQNPALLDISPAIGKKLRLRSIIFSSITLLIICLHILLQSQTLSSSLHDHINTVLLSLLSLSAIYFCRLIMHLPLIYRLSPTIQQSITFILIMILVVNLLIIWLGYINLGQFIIIGLLYSLMASILFYVSLLLFSYLANFLSLDASDFGIRFRQLLGIRTNKHLIEKSLLHFNLSFCGLMAFIVSLMKIWHVSPSYIDNFLQKLLYGFKFFNYDIVPLRIVLALLVFIVLHLFGRYLSTRIKRYHLQDEENKQVAISSIVAYLAFAIAVIVALLISGINFTGLAIVTGALSVGIGFGLREIVNNFVCGIILLIEKPIQAGDRISVAGIEGVVKEVRIRSTQLRTGAREDVLIPNADLITKPVTNALFNDRSARIIIDVGVAYGTNVKIAKQLMLKAVTQVSHVSDSQGNQAKVIFKSFGDSNLLLSLICFVDDIANRVDANSDLHFAINELFNQHGIEMAFPQQDIHIKDWRKS